MEVLLASTLAGLIALSVGAIYFASQRFLVQSVNIASVQGDAHFAIEHMRRNLMVANQMELAGSTTLFYRYDLTPNVDNDDEWAGYRLNAGNLEFVQIFGSFKGSAVPPDVGKFGPGNGNTPDTPEVLARGVSALNLANLPGSNAVVQVQMTVQRTGSGDIPRQHQSVTLIGCRGCP